MGDLSGPSTSSGYLQVALEEPRACHWALTAAFRPEPGEVLRLWRPLMIPLRHREHTGSQPCLGHDLRPSQTKPSVASACRVTPSAGTSATSQGGPGCAYLNSRLYHVQNHDQPDARRPSCIQWFAENDSSKISTNRSSARWKGTLLDVSTLKVNNVVSYVVALWTP